MSFCLFVGLLVNWSICRQISKVVESYTYILAALVSYIVPVTILTERSVTTFLLTEFIPTLTLDIVGNILCFNLGIERKQSRKNSRQKEKICLHIRCYFYSWHHFLIYFHLRIIKVYHTSSNLLFFQFTWPISWRMNTLMSKWRLTYLWFLFWQICKKYFGGNHSRCSLNIVFFEDVKIYWGFFCSRQCLYRPVCGNSRAGKSDIPPVDIHRLSTGWDPIFGQSASSSGK